MGNKRNTVGKIGDEQTKLPCSGKRREMKERIPKAIEQSSDDIMALLIQENNQLLACMHDFNRDVRE